MIGLTLKRTGRESGPEISELQSVIGSYLAVS
jgi:hypothetical protein